MLFEPLFETNAFRPSLVIEIEVGSLPTGMLLTRVFVSRS